MIHAKIKDHMTFGSGEFVLMFLPYIDGHGGHLGHVS